MGFLFGGQVGGGWKPVKGSKALWNKRYNAAASAQEKMKTSSMLAFSLDLERFDTHYSGRARANLNRAAPPFDP